MNDKTALVVIDMFNPYDHEDAEPLAENVAQIIEPLAAMIGEARDAGADVIYVNDNYGDFAATRDSLIQAALDGERPDLIEPIVPAEDDDFMQKVRHSAFYSTALAYLLRRREPETVVLCGQVTEQCILYSALDAYVRHFEVHVPRRCVAALDPELGDAALRMMERNMDVTVL